MKLGRPCGAGSPERPEELSPTRWGLVQWDLSPCLFHNKNGYYRKQDHGTSFPRHLSAQVSTGRSPSLSLFVDVFVSHILGIAKLKILRIRDDEGRFKLLHLGRLRCPMSRVSHLRDSEALWCGWPT